MIMVLLLTLELLAIIGFLSTSIKSFQRRMPKYLLHLQFRRYEGWFCLGNTTLLHRKEFHMQSCMISRFSPPVQLSKERDVHAERGARRAVDARRMGTVATAGVSVMVTVRGTDFNVEGK